MDKVGQWELIMTDRLTIPNQLQLWFKEFRLDGALVSIKRFNPPPVVFGKSGEDASTVGIVANNEVYWYPSSGVDVPVVHPRKINSACLLNENWCTRFVKSRGVRMEYFKNLKREDNKHDPLQTYVSSTPPWLPIDGLVYDPTNAEFNNSAACHSLGAIYCSQSLGIPTRVEIEAKLYFRYRGRKNVAYNINDPTDGTDVFPAIHAPANETTGGNDGLSLMTELSKATDTEDLF